MRKIKNYLKTGILLIGISLLLWNCEKEDSIQNQQTVFETVSIDETISFLNLKKTTSKAKTYTENYVTPNLDDITQEEIINSSELLTIVSASTIYEKHYSRILLLKINQEIRSVVFSMYPSKNSINGKFSGEIMITDLNGDFLNGYRVTEGQLKTQFKLRNTGNKTSVSYKNSSDVCPDHGECTEGSYCVFCNQTLEEVVVTGSSGSSSNYVPITGLYNPDAADQGGGPDIGMGWDYGDGGGSGNDSWMSGDIIVYNPDDPVLDINDFLDCFDITLPATLTIYVNEPNPGTGETHNNTFVGHTFISIAQGNNISTFGFYPVSDNIYPYINNSSNSVLGNDGGGNEPFSASISTSITGSQLSQILNEAINHNPTYHLDTYNCTDFAIEIGNLGGLNLPPSNGTWPGGGGSNPGTLGQYIRSLFSGTNTSGGIAPSTNKAC